MKLYKREGRRFVEIINPADRIGMYVDIHGNFGEKNMSSIGRCVTIEDGYYVIARINDYWRKMSFKEAEINFCRDLNNVFIPSIGLLFYTACKYPELFNKQKQYMSSSSFCYQGSVYSFVRYLGFVSVYQYWDSYGAGYDGRLSVKLFYKIPIL